MHGWIRRAFTLAAMAGYAGACSEDDFSVAGSGRAADDAHIPVDASPPRCTPHVGVFSRIYDPSVGEAQSWYYNDHSIIRGPDGLWHVFAITHADPGAPDDEKAFGHATSESLNRAPWMKQPVPLAVDDRFGERVLWAPYVMEHAGTYYMFYSAGGEPSDFKIRMATSSNLWEWTRAAEPLFGDGAYARDPYVMPIGEQWIMYYTATSRPGGGNFVVAYRTSADLRTWGSRNIAFTDPTEGTAGGNTESPYVVQRPEGYYLFLSLRGGYDSTEVFFSRDPFHFEVAPIARIAAHAPELVQDVDGSWHISDCGWNRGGLYLAPLDWSCDASSK